MKNFNRKCYDYLYRVLIYFDLYLLSILKMAIENIDDKDCKQKVSVLIAEFNELERD